MALRRGYVVLPSIRDRSPILQNIFIKEVEHLQSIPHMYKMKVVAVVALYLRLSLDRI